MKSKCCFVIGQQSSWFRCQQFHQFHMSMSAFSDPVWIIQKFKMHGKIFFDKTIANLDCTFKCFFFLLLFQLTIFFEHTEYLISPILVLAVVSPEPVLIFEKCLIMLNKNKQTNSFFKHLMTHILNSEQNLPYCATFCVY